MCKTTYQQILAAEIYYVYATPSSSYSSALQSKTNYMLLINVR